mmetsp:Transcript_22866/g.70270  ORF Transcript_22866/g.70270 Transcript_22866/m.70270 type:complete len:206 (-) Transcript_22866:725-1342(-)
MRCCPSRRDPATTQERRHDGGRRGRRHRSERRRRGPGQEFGVGGLAFGERFLVDRDCSAKTRTLERGSSTTTKSRRASSMASGLSRSGRPGTSGALNVLFVLTSATDEFSFKNWTRCCAYSSSSGTTTRLPPARASFSSRRKCVNLPLLSSFCVVGSRPKSVIASVALRARFSSATRLCARCAGAAHSAPVTPDFAWRRAPQTAL